MLLPFEGSGVDATWEFRMPKAANLFDYRTLADVLITVEYTALSSFDYRQQVIQSLRPALSADRPFSFRNQFADQWYDLHIPDQTSTPMAVRFTTLREDFPPNLDGLRIQHVVLYFARADGHLFEVPVTSLHFTEQGSSGFVGGGATSIHGAISTRRGAHRRPAIFMCGCSAWRRCSNWSKRSAFRPAEAWMPVELQRPSPY
jgi:receptor-binding and translocation channel-forming TcA subunit of Tc toxin